jgi:hypothetical protein
MCVGCETDPLEFKMEDDRLKFAAMVFAAPVVLWLIAAFVAGRFIFRWW